MGGRVGGGGQRCAGKLAGWCNWTPDAALGCVRLHTCGAVRGSGAGAGGELPWVWCRRGWRRELVRQAC